MQSHMQLHPRVERSDGTEKPEDISELAELPYAFSVGGGCLCVCQGVGGIIQSTGSARCKVK